MPSEQTVHVHVCVGGPGRNQTFISLHNSIPLLHSKHCSRELLSKAQIWYVLCRCIYKYQTGTHLCSAYMSPSKSSALQALWTVTQLKYNVQFLPGTATLCTTPFAQHTILTNLSGGGYKVYIADTTTQGSVNNQRNEFTVAMSLGLPCFYSAVVWYMETEEWLKKNKQTSTQGRP